VNINLEGDCGPDCAQLAESKHEQLSNGRYTFPCSILELPESIEAHLATHRTARKRAGRSRRLGYTFAEIDRTRHEQDVFEINTSTDHRQGRPMSEGYRQPVKFSPLNYDCSRHSVNTYGVLKGEKLVAYTWIYRVGELVMFSQILGHADHLAADIMYLLVNGTLEAEIRNGPGFAFYNRHDSGTDGLRYFKERLGFRPARVEWVLA
jgi:hypothetical protein